MSGKKFYFETEQGGLTFKTERRVGHVRIPNYVYDLWLPILGITAIGIYSVYCRLEREGTCKGMTQRRLAKMCHIGAKKLSVINELLQKHGFVRIKKPAGKARLMHYSTEITIIDPPRELSKEVIDAAGSYELLSPWLLESPKASNDASPNIKGKLYKAPTNAPKVEALCLNPSDIEDNLPVSKISPLGESPEPDTPPEPPAVPVLTLGRSPQPPQATEPATPGDQPNSDAPIIVGHRHIHQPVNQSVLGDLPTLSVTVGYPEPPSAPSDATAPDTPPEPPTVPVMTLGRSGAKPPRDYLTDVFNYAKRTQPGEKDTHIRPKHWETVSDDEYAICERVAQLWCGGRLPFPGSIEAHCGAAGWLLHDLNGGNLGACIRALDEYHLHYEQEKMTFTVAGPKSLVSVLPAFLAAEGGGGEPGVIRVGG